MTLESLLLYKTWCACIVCRDVSALHYDPSREEHAAFESKVDSSKNRYGAIIVPLIKYRSKRIHHSIEL